MKSPRLSLEVEGLEGRKLLARIAVVSPMAADVLASEATLAPQLRPLTYQFGHYNATFRFASGKVARSQIEIEPSADGRSVFGSRHDASPGQEHRLWSVGINRSGRDLVITKSFADGSTMHGLYTQVRPRVAQIDGVIDRANGTTEIERIRLTSVNSRTMVLTDQVLVGGVYRTMQVGVFKRV